MDASPSRGAAHGSARPRPLGLGKVNLLLLLAGVVAVLFGYVLLDRGSITAAPLLLVAGYGILIPVGLLFGFRGRGGRGPDHEAEKGE